MKRILVKVGSGVLVEAGDVNDRAIGHIAEQLVGKAGRAAIVTSGFAAAGGGENEDHYRVGGERIADVWQKKLGAAACGLHLVSQDSLGAVAAIMDNAMMAGGTPLANGHWGDRDFGSNDLLAAKLAVELGMDAVVFLGTVGGVYSNYGRAGQKLISDINGEATSNYHQFAERGSDVGTGGIIARLDAAEYAAAYGLNSHIGHWRTPITDLLDGAGTTVHAMQNDGVLIFAELVDGGGYDAP